MGLRVKTMKRAGPYTGAAVALETIYQRIF